MNNQQRMPLDGAFFVFSNNNSFLFVVILSLAALAYSAGLEGPFIFDDHATLPVLSDLGGVRSWEDLLRFVSSGFTGPMGRPIALLSFLADSTTWPADPWPFKLTNLLLHLLTGVLLQLLVYKLLAGRTDKARAIALLTAAFWLLNPFNVSTTLYVVQRMAILSALFVLAGLICYVHGRLLLPTRPLAAYAWMSFGLMVFTPLAFLSKENGALLPALALVLEVTALRSTVKSPRLHRVWLLLFLILPSLLVAYKVLAYAIEPHAYSARPFDLPQRLMTEGRILWDYVWHWFNPLVVGRGVLADDYTISKSLFEPWTTLPAGLGIIAALAWAISMTRTQPIASMAILFFLVGHGMESTVLPLEPYFEHRNYLPAMMLVLPVSYWAVRAFPSWRIKPLVLSAVIAVQAIQTARLAIVWSNELSLATWWAQHSPRSNRAQGFLATSLSNAGRPDLAAGILKEGMRMRPDHAHFHLHYLVEKCRSGGLDETDWEIVTNGLSQRPLDIRSYPLLSTIVSWSQELPCPGLVAAKVLHLIDSQARLKELHGDSERLGQLQHLRGEVLISLGRPDESLEAFRASLELRPRLDVGMQQVAILAQNGHFEFGLEWLERVSQLPRPKEATKRIQDWNYDVEIPRMRETLRSEIRSVQGMGDGK